MLTPQLATGLKTIINIPIHNWSVLFVLTIGMSFRFLAISLSPSIAARRASIMVFVKSATGSS